MTLASRPTATDADALALDARALALDARALASLDQALALDAAARRAWLAAMAEADPPLHARVLRLLAFCPPTGDGSTGQAAASRAVAGPLLAGLRQAASPGLAPGQLLAGWRLLCELGRGGMSVVWLAERADGGIKRRVALKLPLAAHLCAVLAERFDRERDVLAQLVHPHIARLYDAGVAENGQPFLVLEHVSGLPITQFADERHLSLRQRLQLFGQVLAAVDHAHRHLVVHRDLKPANILVDDDGQVKLLDFGIAKLLDAPAGAAQLTLEADAVMTPRYAAPEQVAGQAISTATDVYAAGAVLYELLTGRPPHPGTADDAAAPAAAMARLAQAVLHTAPPLPSQAALDRAQRRLLAGDIDTVVMTALRKAPAERYPSAERFAEDLRRVLADEPVLARRVPLWHRARLLLRRHRRLSAAAALAGVLLLGVAAVALQQWQASRAQTARADAVRDFMFTVVSDAEPNDTQAGTEVTGRQILDAAMQRAELRLASQPVLLGEVLGELGRIFARLGADTEARQALGRAVQLLESASTPGDPALHKARAHLAAQLPPEAADRARRLAESVVNGCTRPGADCAMARSYAHGALVSMLSAQGDDRAALAQSQWQVQAARAAFGPDAPDLAVALEWQAIVHRRLGQFQAARAAIDGALTIATRNSLRASHRHSLQRTQAMLQMDLGDTLAAREQLQRLSQASSQHAERALELRLLASADWALGMPAQSLAAAREAALAARTADDPLEAALADLIAARALAALGDAQAAAVGIRQVQAWIDAQGAQGDAVLRWRSRRLGAEAAIRAGRLADAGTALADAPASQTPAGADLLDQVEWLDLRGALARLQGDLRQGRQLHAEAQRLLVQAGLPATHRLVLRNRLYAELASAPLNTAALGDAAHAFLASQHPKSSWRGPLLQFVSAAAAGKAVGADTAPRPHPLVF